MATPPAGAPALPLPLSLDALTDDSFRARTVAGVQWLPDSTAFTFTTRDPSLQIHRRTVPLPGAPAAAEEEQQLLLDTATLEVVVTDYATTGRQQTLLLTGQQQPIWRHSYSAPYYLYNTASATLTALADGDQELQNVAFAPSNELVAYVKQCDLFVYHVQEAREVRLTADGTDQVLNGIFDWVYEEEFGRSDAFRWSPDSQKIAFWHTDQTRVKNYALFDDTTANYPQVSSLKYPKVGEQNAIVKIGVVTVATGEIVWIDLGEDDDIYIARIDWTTETDTLALQRLNRKQNKLELLFAEVVTGKTRTVLQDENVLGWVDVTDDFIFFERQQRFLWTSEKSGFRHIYLSNYLGEELAAVTQGEWEVSRILKFDEQQELVYFVGKKHGIVNQCLYSVTLTGEITLLSADSGWHSASFSPDSRHCVTTTSSSCQPNQVALKTAAGQTLRTLEANELPALTTYSLSWPEFFFIPTQDGEQLSAYLIKPPTFDPSKKYPVIVYGYSGPASQMVTNRWWGRRALFHSLLTQRDALVFCVDHRGTGGRGRAFKDYAYGDISKYLVSDQIQGAQYLRSLPYVDSTRIGVWGWSGGGYLTCLLLLRAAEYFSTGIAVAPVSDFRLYDTIWTERYMGLLSENLEGYEAADVNTYVSNLRGNLLLVHGSGDDNVHVSNTMRLVEKFQEANLQFDLMVYPNLNHALPTPAAQRHLYTMMTRYFTQHLSLSPAAGDQ